MAATVLKTDHLMGHLTASNAENSFTCAKPHLYLLMQLQTVQKYTERKQKAKWVAIEDDHNASITT